VTDLHGRFSSLDALPAPDLWPEAEVRAAAPEADRTSQSTLMAVGLAMILMVLLGSAVLIGSGILPRPTPFEIPAPTGSDSPDATVDTTDDAPWTAAEGFVPYREDHALTLLTDGRVLATGNGSAHVFDPRSGALTETARMSVPRLGHSATLLTDGTVLVAGGGSDSSGTTTFPSAELFDPVTGTWHATGLMLEARRDHTATLLADGKVLLAGGRGGGAGTTPGAGGTRNLSSAEIYDPTTGAWTAAASMGEWRTGHTATLLGDGTVLVVGGFSQVADIYDPTTDTWTTTGAMVERRDSHIASLLLDGRVLVAGGGFPLLDSAEIYDPESRTWTATASMNEARSWFAATTLADGRVLVTGGGDGGYGGSPTAEVWDPISEAWTPRPNMLSGHGWHEAIGLRDGRVLVVGGYGDDVVADPVAEIYDPEAN
jgi:hypothetical protein